VPADVKAKVEAKLKDLQDAIASDNTATMKTAMETLNQEVMAMGQSVYQSGAPGGDQPPPGGAPGGGAGAKPDDVIDADFSS
jgi:L1 cell adhesion molecule like protein